MELNLYISKNGISEKTIRLAEGSYTMGRSGDCDIVLSDPSVSKTHATIEIATDGAVVEDAGSVNGIFDKNEKISRRTYPSGFELSIGPFILKGAGDTKGTGDASRREPKPSGGFLEVLSRVDLRLLLFISFGLIVVAAYLGIRMPVKQQVVSIRQQETANRRILLARYLSEINRYAVENNQIDNLRIDPVNMEDGVVYAYLVNTDGQVLAPVEDRGDFLDWPWFSAALKKGTIDIGVGKKNEQIVFYPLKVFNQIKAAAVVGYENGAAHPQAGEGESTGAYALLFILIALGGLLAALILKAFLKPLRNLEEEVRVALKNNQTQIEFRAPYREIEELVQLFNRMLERAPAPAPAAPHSPEVPASSPPVLDVNPTDYLKDFERLGGPGCVLDTRQSQIVGFNDAFKALCGNQQLTEGMHVLEVFQQPKMLKAVSDLIDSPDPAGVQVAETDPPIQIQKRPAADDAGNIILIFEELPHE